MTVAENTKDKIIKAAFDFTSKFGLESLSIGELAKTVGMSKSGLFGHFKSKEKLQMMVLDFTAENFTLRVVRPAIKKPRGIERMESMVDNWIKWSTSTTAGGCPFVAAAVEFDNRPGKIRDHLQMYLSKMLNNYSRACEIAIEEGQIREDIDTEQFAYELYSLMIGFQVYSSLLGDKKAKTKLKNGFHSLIERVQV
jgi:AcrR family transcriptional regulator